MKKADIFYLCNGKCDCNSSANCYVNTQKNPCKRTSNIKYAKNFEHLKATNCFVEIENPKRVEIRPEKDKCNKWIRVITLILEATVLVGVILRVLLKNQ